MMCMVKVSLVLALMTLWTSSNALGRSNYQHLHVGTKNQDQLLLAQLSKPSRFPFSGVKFNAIKITQEDIDMAIMKCIEMDENFNYENPASAAIEMTPASKHVFQSICDSSITTEKDQSFVNAD